MKRIFGAFILALVCAQLVLGTNYYVDNSCTNNGNGTATSCSGSPGGSGPFNSIANAQSGLTGDQHGNSLLLAATETFREEYDVPANGTAAGQFTVGTYGAGAAPIIRGSNVFSSWTPETSTPASPTLLCSNSAVAGLSVACTHAIANSGDLLIVTAFVGTVETLTLADTKGNSWVTNSTTPVVFAGMYTAFNRQQTWYVAANNGSGSDTFTVSGASGNFLLDVTEWTASAASPYDGQNAVNAGASTKNLDSGASTGSSGNTEDLVYGACVAANALSLGTNIAFASLDNRTSFAGAYTLIEWAIGAGNSHAQCSQGTASVFGAQVLTFTSAAAPTIYYATTATQPYQVFRDTVPLVLAASKVAMTTGQWWWDSGNGRIYVYDNPAGHTIEASQRTYGVQINAQNYVTVQGIQIDETNSSCVFVGGNSTNFLLSGNTLNYCGSQYWNISLFVDGATAGRITGNTVTNSPHDGIYLSGYGPATTSNITVDHNTVHNSGRFGISVGAGGGTGPTNSTIEYNSISASSQVVDDASGIETFGSGVGGVIAYNFISGTGTSGFTGTGIMIDYQSSATLIYGNIITGSSHNGIFVTGSGHVIYNNTLYNNDLNYPQGEITLGTVSGTGASSVLVKNNIVYNALSEAVLQVDAGSVGGGNTLNYNDYYSGSATPFSWNGTAYNFANYKTASSQDANSLNTAPTFANAGTGQFWLLKGSAGIGAGIDLGAPYNVGLMPASTWPSGVVTRQQSSPPTIGAYDYVVPNIPHPVIF